MTQKTRTGKYESEKSDRRKLRATYVTALPDAIISDQRGSGGGAGIWICRRRRRRWRHCVGVKIAIKVVRQWLMNESMKIENKDATSGQSLQGWIKRHIFSLLFFFFFSIPLTFQLFLIFYAFLVNIINFWLKCTSSFLMYFCNFPFYVLNWAV